MLLADGVVTSGVVVGGILFACDQLLRVEELAVGSSTDLIYEEKKEEAHKYTTSSNSLLIKIKKNKKKKQYLNKIMDVENLYQIIEHTIIHVY